MNITDVGHMTDDVTDTGRDKMELAEADEGLSAPEIAQKYTDGLPGRTPTWSASSAPTRIRARRTTSPR